MSRSTALDAARHLRDSLLDHGAGRVVSPFTQRTGGVSIELQMGRGPSADPWHARTHVAHLNHHTASATITPSRLTPSLYICKNGRSGLQGPLCNGYGGGDFYYRILTLGWANHPGLGGPANFAGKVVPKDNGRPYLFGTEWDWPGLLSTPWPDAYEEWMARCNAGILDWMGRPAEAQGEHKDPWAPDRKVDRRMISRAQSISRTRLVWGTEPIQEDPMAAFTEADIRRFVREEVRKENASIYGLTAYGDQRVDTVPDTHPENLQRIRQELDALRQLIEDRLPASEPSP
jgi:hypothetical protein